MNLANNLENLITKELNTNFFQVIQKDLPAIFTVARLFLWNSHLHHKDFKFYEQRVDMGRSLEFVRETLKLIDVAYYDKLNELIENAKEPGKFCLKILPQSIDFPKKSGLAEDGKLYLYYYETIEDAFVLLDIFMDYLLSDEEAHILNFYGDKSLSFIASLVLEDYISKQDFFNTEFRNYKYNQLKLAYESSSYLLFIGRLLEFYIKKASSGEHFDENILEEIKASEDYSSIFYKILNDDIYRMANNLVIYDSLNLNKFIKDIILILTSFQVYTELHEKGDYSYYTYLVGTISNHNAAASFENIVRSKYLGENNNLKIETINSFIKYSKDHINSVS